MRSSFLQRKKSRISRHNFIAAPFGQCFLDSLSSWRASPANGIVAAVKTANQIAASMYHPTRAKASAPATPLRPNMSAKPKPAPYPLVPYILCSFRSAGTGCCLLELRGNDDHIATVSRVRYRAILAINLLDIEFENAAADGQLGVPPAYVPIGVTSRHEVLVCDRVLDSVFSIH